jgi:tetratricopeptide (TPR) repeat protein
MVKRFLSPVCALALLLSSFQHSADAQDPNKGERQEKAVNDPMDPFDIFTFDELGPSTDDTDKTADELVREASLLLATERPLDARTKLLKAIQKDPQKYRAYYLLSGYYLVHVGHYRLALKYIRQAQELFEKEHGKPPYSSQLLQLEHGNLLYYLSQTRLNLDNYQGALDALDLYSSYGYHAEWYAGSRSWVLMKLGRIQEAIKVARQGLLASSETGRTLNMLGILLSMNDQPQESLEVFRQAIAYEFSQGRSGQPATPLNNAGEVYKELFDDVKAESTFLRATSLPDGCEHVLPSLNLTLLYIEQHKMDAALSTMDAFQRCIAQFPLRNNEEHAALVNLARGRIDLHTGNVERAIKRFETSLQGTQWFGKIGTNQDDLAVAATISLAQALLRQNNILAFHQPATWAEWLEQRKTRTENSLRAWWLFRRARQMLIDDLNDIEDLTIRNTDSLLEYPTLGEALSGLSNSALSRRINAQRERDSRAVAKVFYDAYLAETERSMFFSGASNDGFDSVIQRGREGFDTLLKTHAMLRRMESLSPDSERYRELAYRVFYTAAPELRNYGFRLPVAIDQGKETKELRSSLEAGPFRDATGKGNLCTVAAANASAPKKIALRFSCPSQSNKNRLVEGDTPGEVVNKLSDALFREEIRNVGTN